MLKSIVVAALLALVATGASAQSCPTGPSYYVKSNGNDGGNGTSVATAWGTLAKVSTFKFPAGSCVHQLTNMTGNLSLDGKYITGTFGYDCGSHKITPATTTKPTIKLNALPKSVDLLNCLSQAGSTTLILNGVSVTYSGIGVVTIGDAP